jgi:hypothetical protein
MNFIVESKLNAPRTPTAVKLCAEYPIAEKVEELPNTHPPTVKSTAKVELKLTKKSPKATAEGSIEIDVSHVPESGPANAAIPNPNANTKASTRAFFITLLPPYRFNS